MEIILAKNITAHLGNGQSRTIPIKNYSIIRPSQEFRLSPFAYAAKNDGLCIMAKQNGASLIPIFLVNYSGNCSGKWLSEQKLEISDENGNVTNAPFKSIPDEFASWISY